MSIEQVIISISMGRLGATVVIRQDKMIMASHGWRFEKDVVKSKKDPI